MTYQLRKLQQAALLSFVIAALLSFTSFGVAFGQTPAPPSSSQAATDSTTDFTTANGLKTIHRRVPGNEVVAVRLYFKGGARNITAKNAGIEPLMLEVAQQGTKIFPRARSIVSWRARARSSKPVATTITASSPCAASASTSTARGSSSPMSRSIRSSMKRRSRSPRDQLISALRQENDDPDSTVASASNRLLYAAHPYINRPSGTVESIGSLTAADLKAYHSTHLATSRLLLVVVGNITPEDIKRKVEASFGKLPQGDFKPEPPPSFSHAAPPEFELTERPVQTNYIRGVFAAPPLSHPDYPALSVAINILQQLFFQEVRVQRNLSYGADATLLAQGTNSGYLYVTTAKPNETLVVMYDQIEFLQRQVIPREPLRAIVSGFLTTYYDKLQTNDAQAARLGEYELLGGGWRRSLNWIDEVNKVTPEDIQRVSRAYLKNFHFAVIGSASKFDRALFISR